MTTHMRKYIFTEERRGSGIEADPTRLVPQLWTEGGKLVAEWDPHTGVSYFRPDGDNPWAVGYAFAGIPGCQ